MLTGLYTRHMTTGSNGSLAVVPSSSRGIQHRITTKKSKNLLTEVYWVPPNPLSVGGWIPFPLMLGVWIQPVQLSFSFKIAYKDIFSIPCDAHKASWTKRSSLRCFSMVSTLSPVILTNWNSHKNSSPLGLLGGRLNN